MLSSFIEYSCISTDRILRYLLSPWAGSVRSGVEAREFAILFFATPAGAGDVMREPSVGRPQDDEDVAEALCFKPSWGGTAAGGLGGRRARAAAARRASGGSDDDDDEEALVIVRGAERGALD